MIFEQVLEISSAKVLAYPEKEINDDNKTSIDNIIEGLLNKKPIQYLFGSAHFYDLQFKVNTKVLIPRPETEELVHWILEDHGNEQRQIIDIGTGSGAIAISLAANRQSWKVYALDISDEAIKTAENNARLNKTEVTFFKTDVLQSQSLLNNNCFDIIVSNPPYVCNNEKQLMEANVLDNEPHLALFVPDHNPLIFYKKIAELAFKQLNNNGFLYFEINEKFGKETIALLNEIGFTNTVLRKDLSGKDRMIKASK